MKTEEAVLKIAKILDALVGHFIPDCGGDFKQGTFYCKGCASYYQCKRGTEVQDLNTELQRLLADEEFALEMAYGKGFNDALNGHTGSNPYDPEKEYGLQKQYARGYFDGAV